MGKKIPGRYRRLLAVTVLTLLLTLTALQFIVPDRQYSALERRNLSQAPKLTAVSLMDGTYMTSAETWMADQFAGRDFWVYFYSLWQRLMGIQENNGVLRCKDGYLMQRFEPGQTASQTTEALLRFLSETDCSAYVMAVPNSISVLSELTPYGSVQKDQRRWFLDWKSEAEAFLSSLNTKSVALLDLYPAMRQAAEQDGQIYYKTDHHWTTYGAYTAFCELASAMELDRGLVKWENVTVCSKFQGSLSAKSGFYGSNADTIDLYLPDRDIPLVVSYEEEQKKTTSLYDSDALAGSDPYEVFLGGNFPMIRITAVNGSSRKLLILKDSYANAFVGFLTPYFCDITMIDARYYSGEIRQLIRSQEYTDILVLYNINTLCEDNSLRLILENGDE